MAFTSPGRNCLTKSTELLASMCHNLPKTEIAKCIDNLFTHIARHFMDKETILAEAEDNEFPVLPAISAKRYPPFGTSWRKTGFIPTKCTIIWRKISLTIIFGLSIPGSSATPVQKPDRTDKPARNPIRLPLRIHPAVGKNSPTVFLSFPFLSGNVSRHEW